MAHLARTEDVVHTPYIPATAAPGYPLASRRLASAARLILIAAGLPSLAGAQARTGTISGFVKDSAGGAIAGVVVLAVRTGVGARTDSAGHFALTSLPSGPMDLSLKRIAYEPVVVSVDVPRGDTTEIEIRLGSLAAPLAAVVVNDQSGRLRGLAEFESRRKTGVGHFITRAEIEKRHPLRLSEMTRTIPGTTILSGENGRTALRFARAQTGCVPQYFLDGQRVSATFTIDDVPPADVEGVELYAGPAGVPPQFTQLHGMPDCGTVAIWTRVPGNTPAKP